MSILCPGGVCRLCHLCCCLHDLDMLLGVTWYVSSACQVAGIKAEVATCWYTICCKLTVLSSIWLLA